MFYPDLYYSYDTDRTICDIIRTQPKKPKNNLNILKGLAKKHPVKIQVTEDKPLLILSLYSGEDYFEPQKKISKMFYKIYFSKRF